MDDICEGWKVDMTHCHKWREKKPNNSLYISGFCKNHGMYCLNGATSNDVVIVVRKKK
jgi:hypothetical protein